LDYTGCKTPVPTKCPPVTVTGVGNCSAEVDNGVCTLPCPSGYSGSYSVTCHVNSTGYEWQLRNTCVYVPTQCPANTFNEGACPALHHGATCTLPCPAGYIGNEIVTCTVNATAVSWKINYSDCDLVPPTHCPQHTFTEVVGTCPSLPNGATCTSLTCPPGKTGTANAVCRITGAYTSWTLYNYCI
jgi:hypothetical protein